MLLLDERISQLLKRLKKKEKKNEEKKKKKKKDKLRVELKERQCAFHLYCNSVFFLKIKNKK